ncbi:MAG: hypothetical protein AAB513_02915 [Patescibacteria group bacterium]
MLEKPPSLSYEEIKRHIPVPEEVSGNSNYSPRDRLNLFYYDINSLEDVTKKSELAGIYDKQAGELWEKHIASADNGRDKNPQFQPTLFLEALTISIKEYNFFSEEIRERLLARVQEKLEQIN